MTGKSKIRALIKALKLYQPEKIILFGSKTRGKEDNFSDIDLIVIKKTKRNFFERLREISKKIPLELEPVDILVYTPEEILRMKKVKNPFITHALKSGEVIYEAS